MNTDDFLMHHGIKGQKWGVRRFQNEDGSLTSAGKRRLAQTSDSDKRDRLVRGHDTSVRLAKEYADDAKMHAKQLKFGQAYADRRLSKESARKAERNARKIAKIDDKAEADARKAIKDQRKHYAKNASLLSDAELNAQISRLQREKQLKNLTSEVVTPGRYKAKQMVDRYGSQILSAAVGGVATGIGMRYVNAFMDKNLAKQGFKVKGYNADGTPNYGENKKDD
jgi:hypothetical protein